jgi:lysophospholipase L1-like esterase
MKLLGMSRKGLVAIAVAAGLISIVVSQIPGLATTRTAVVSAAAPVWTGTWAAAPQSTGDSFSQQTLREIVHTSISGTAARVQLSNVFGSSPVTISDVHIAQQTSGSSVDPSTDRTVTFGGSPSVTIPAGGTAKSDSIPFAVQALSNVAISFYLPDQTANATGHESAQETSYISQGDVAGNATLDNPQTTNDYDFLANLDVQNPAAEGAVVALGASITDGVTSPPDANLRWTDDLAVRLNQAGKTVGVLNEGISGNSLLSDGAGQSAVHRFSRDVLSQPNVKWVIFADDPINDLNTANPATGAQLIAALSQMISAAHQAGVRFICATLTPFQGTSNWSQAGEDGRDAYNAFVRSAASGCDGVVDFDAATHDPANPLQYAPQFDSGDHLHPNTAGLQAMANAINLNLFDASTASTPVISLRARANGMIVTADQAGARPLIANRTVIGSWEQFDEIDLGNGNIALRAHANNMFVTAEQAGPHRLIANGTAMGSWETFQLIHNPDGSVSLKAQANGKYVRAGDAGALPLIANGTVIGPWAQFDLIND